MKLNRKKFTRVNTPNFIENSNVVECVFESIEEIQSEYEKEQILFVLSHKGTQSVMKFNIYTGFKIDSVKRVYNIKKNKKNTEPVYNNLTQLCLSCEILTLDEVNDNTELNDEKIQDGLLNLEGKKCIVELHKDTEDFFYKPIISTLRLIK
jgi:hypothetical protein